MNLPTKSQSHEGPASSDRRLPASSAADERQDAGNTLAGGTFQSGSCWPNPVAPAADEPKVVLRDHVFLGTT